MKKNTYKLMLPQFLFTVLVLNFQYQLSNCTFEPSDLIESKTGTDTILVSSTKSYNDIIAFPDNKFAILYIDENEKGYFYVTQYGQIISGPTKYNLEPNQFPCRTVVGHNYQDDKLIIIYSVHTSITADLVDPRLVVFDLDGQMIKNDIDIFPNTRTPVAGDPQQFWTFFVQNISGDNLVICAEAIPYTLMWDTLCSTYNYNSHTIGSYKRMNDYTDLRQRLSGLAKIDDNRYIIVIKGNNAQYPTLSEGSLSLAEFNDNLDIVGGVFSVIPGTQNYHTAVTVPTKNNGFALLTIDGNGTVGTNKPYIISYNSNKSQKCFKEIPFSGTVLTYSEGASVPNYDMISHGDYLYIVIIEKDSQDVYGLIVNIDTCELADGQSEQVIVQQVASLLIQIEKNENQNGVSMGINIRNTYSTDIKLDYFQYFIEQIGTCSEDNRCFGCYDKSYCPLCISSDLSNRDNREYNSGVCGCKGGFFEDFPKIDCQECGKYCATCENTTNYCLTCKGTQRNISDNTCACNSNYYDDGTLDCQQCGSLCQECETKSFNCTVCKEQNRKLPLCSDCIELHSEINGTCQKCRIGCATCDNLTECKTCLLTNLSPPDCIQQGFLIITDQNNNLVIQQCDHQCEICESKADKCESCKGQNRESVPSCLCKTGYHDNEQRQSDCQECGNNCSQCRNAHSCLKCLSDDTHILKNGQCVCQDGYYDEKNDGKCVKCDGDNFVQNNKCLPCFYYHDSCVELCPQHTIKTGKICEIEEQSQTAMIIFIVLLVLFIFGFIGFMVLQILKKQINKEKKDHQVVASQIDEENLKRNKLQTNQQPEQNQDNIDSIINDIDQSNNKMINE